MIVIATAGHVDHGKSALIRRLTGIEPDRWAEEQRRGLTIDLGFAWATTPGGIELGFVDVPGHERFIANMLAGVGSVPAVLLVIDASEGWRAQTSEHVEILDLLEVRHGIVAITKSDRVEAAQLEAVEQDTRARLSTTTLAGTPIVAVSSSTGHGIDALWAAFDAIAGEVRASADGYARMWIDRVFAVHGAGTVATGTLNGGSVEIGATLRTMPEERDARVRALHRHGVSTDRVTPVSRTAINLSGVDADALRRGTLLTADPAARASKSADVELRLSPRLRDTFTGRGDHRIHLGTLETPIRIQLLDGTAGPGERLLARIHAATQIPLRANDRFIVRDTGRGAIVAGGRVLDPEPPSAPIAERLPALATMRATQGRLALAGALLADRGHLPIATFAGLVGGDLSVGVVFDDHVTDGAWSTAAAAELRVRLTEFHTAGPLAAGMLMLDARTLVGLPERAMRAWIASAPDLVDDGASLRLASFTPALDRLEPVRDALRAMEMRPLDRRDLEERFGADTISAMLRAGDLIAVSAKILLEATVHAHAVGIVLRALEAGPQPTTVLRELLGTSRKVALPFLESLDLAGVTRFDGTVRQLGPHGSVRVR